MNEISMEDRLHGLCMSTCIRMHERMYTYYDVFIISKSLLSKDILAERGNILIVKLEVHHTPAGHRQTDTEIMVRMK